MSNNLALLAAVAYGKFYNLNNVMDKSHLSIEGRNVELIAGIAVSVEIKTGERRVIDYLLSPLRKVIDDSFKER